MIRIVKMTFNPNKVEEFLNNFNQVKDKISTFKGVEHLKLLNDKDNTNIFFTYSIWNSEIELEAYRNSELFKSVWLKTKPLFSKKAEAWSLETIIECKQK